MPSIIERDFWDVPPLPAEDQVLVDIYSEIGVPVDQLPYSASIDQLVQRLGRPESDEEKRLVYQRLLSLRKRGRLPRVG